MNVDPSIQPTVGIIPDALAPTAGDARYTLLRFDALEGANDFAMGVLGALADPPPGVDRDGLGPIELWLAPEEQAWQAHVPSGTLLYASRGAMALASALGATVHELGVVPPEYLPAGGWLVVSYDSTDVPMR